MPKTSDDGRRGGGPRASEADEYRLLLLARSRAGEADDVLRVLAELSAHGVEPESGDHLALLVAYQLRGRGEDAEAYLRTLPRHLLTAAHFHAVLAAYAFARRAPDAERFYSEFEESGSGPDDDCRAMLLTALGFAHDAPKAREWFDRWAVDGKPGAVVTAALIDAHAYPEALGELRALDAAMSATLKRDPQIAGALVNAFALAGDPAAAELHLGRGLAGCSADDDREALIEICLRSYVGLARGGVERLLLLAAEAGVDLELADAELFSRSKPEVT